MASFVSELVVEAPAASCWDAIRDFEALHKRLAPGFITDLEMIGPRERKITFFMGAVATEFLVDSDDAHMRLAYTVTESPMGSSHHNASIQVVPEGEGQCRLVWITDVLPDELGERSGELMETGIRVIKRTLEASTPKSIPK
jgi:carbon monoxide dehydrogenase subunit G